MWLKRIEPIRQHRELCVCVWMCGCDLASQFLRVCVCVCSCRVLTAHPDVPFAACYCIPMLLYYIIKYCYTI